MVSARCAPRRRAGRGTPRPRRSRAARPRARRPRRRRRGSCGRPPSGSRGTPRPRPRRARRGGTPGPCARKSLGEVVEPDVRGELVRAAALRVGPAEPTVAIRSEPDPSPLQPQRVQRRDRVPRADRPGIHGVVLEVVVRDVPVLVPEEPVRLHGRRGRTGPGRGRRAPPTGASRSAASPNSSRASSSVLTYA